MAPRRRNYPNHPATEGGLTRAERYTSGGKPTRYRCRLCGLLVAGENALLESYQHSHDDNEWKDWVSLGSVDASTTSAAARLRNLNPSGAPVDEIKHSHDDLESYQPMVYSLDVAIQAHADKTPDPVNEVASEYRLIPQEFIGFTQHLLSRLRYTEGVLAKYRHASISDELGKAYDEYRGLKVQK
jgi:hypothetical protein